MVITSLDNKKIKEVVKLRQKKYRDIENKFIIETLNIIKEAYNMGYLLELYVLEGTVLKDNFDVPINYVSKNVFNKISSLENSYIFLASKLLPVPLSPDNKITGFLPGYKSVDLIS